jgi:hypothetical protein
VQMLRYDQSLCIVMFNPEVYLALADLDVPQNVMGNSET